VNRIISRRAKVAGVSAVPHLYAAQTDPESSLNRTVEKIVAEICTGKSDFMGFPVHISATIGSHCAQRSIKVFSQPVTHKVIGLVERVSNGGIGNAECRMRGMPSAECQVPNEGNAECQVPNEGWRIAV
jgi:hypothetical protein